MSDNDKEFQRYKRDVEYLEAHYSELLRRYPDEWIAIYDQKVVGSSPELTPLLDQIKSAGIAPGVALTEYLSTHDEVLILTSSDDSRILLAPLR